MHAHEEFTPIHVDTLADAFEQYRRRVLPKATPTEVEEACRAFYYGGFFVLLAMLSVSIEASETEGSDERLVTWVERMTKEVDMFDAAPFLSTHELSRRAR